MEPTLADGRSALQVALAVVESAGSGHPVEILPEPAKSRPGLTRINGLLAGEEGSDLRIQDPRARTNGATSRVAATIVWEDCDRSGQEVYYEAPGSYAENMAPNPHAFR